jgi:hypothetical protein
MLGSILSNILLVIDFRPVLELSTNINRYWDAALLLEAGMEDSNSSMLRLQIPWPRY